MSAAVADFTPNKVSDIKIKSSVDLSINLKKTKDILKSLGDVKSNHQTLVGFALETNDELTNAKSKLASKNLDFIVLNSLNDKGAGFNHDTNKITIIDRDNKIFKFELKSKHEVANDIINYLIEKINE